MMIRVECDGEAVEGAAPVSSRKDFALLSLMLADLADVGILATSRSNGCSGLEESAQEMESNRQQEFVGGRWRLRVVWKMRGLVADFPQA